MVSTGSTAASIRDAGLAVTDVSDVTGFPESLDGRVKTLHPGVHAGILADLRLASHEQQLVDLGISPFELVVVNLYPFRETVASGAPENDVIEQIDIGGPALVRASAKNHANVAVVVLPSDYARVLAQVTSGGTTLELRRELAAERGQLVRARREVSLHLFGLGASRAGASLRRELTSRGRALSRATR